jgi:hypothetical protein
MATIGSSCLEVQWAAPVSLTCHFVLRKLYTELSIEVSYQIQLIWPHGFKEDFFKLANHKHELPMVAILVV